MTLPDVIIPAHNEATTIAAVIAAARASQAVGQVIVVVDKSTDATRAAATDADHVLTSLAGDKGSAVATGLGKVETDTTVLLDADVLGLRPGHVLALATRGPVVGQVVGLRSNKGWAGGLPSLSGERRVPTWLLERAAPAGKGWALETHLNALVGLYGLPWRHLQLVGVANPTKVLADPLGWLTEAAVVVGATALELPGLVDYVWHPNGRMRAVARTVL